MVSFHPERTLIWLVEEQMNGSGSRGGSWSSLEIIMEREGKIVFLLGCSAITRDPP